MNYLQSLFHSLQQKIDGYINYITMFGALVVIFLLVSSMFRFLFGKKAQIGISITSAMEVLCMYMVCIVINSFRLQWHWFINPLPFIALHGDQLLLFPILSAGFRQVCTQVLGLLIICFLVNLMNSVLPEGKKIFVWLAFRIIAVILAVLLNYYVDTLLNQYLSNGFEAIAPFVLVGVLVMLILLGSMKILVGAAITIANPVIGILYTFFFSNLIGRALARSILSTGLIVGLVVLLNIKNLVIITVTAANLIAFIPFLMLLVLLWYVVDRIV